MVIVAVAVAVAVLSLCCSYAVAMLCCRCAVAVLSLCCSYAVMQVIVDNFINSLFHSSYPQFAVKFWYIFKFCG